MNAEFISQNNGELAFGIPSSEIVWKIYVFQIKSLKKAAEMASARI
jgi:hypothetical protein